MPVNYGPGGAGGGGGAPVSATYITQTADGGLSNEQALSALASGPLINTTSTGVLNSIGLSSPGKFVGNYNDNVGYHFPLALNSIQWGYWTAQVSNSSNKGGCIATTTETAATIATNQGINGKFITHQTSTVLDNTAGLVISNPYIQRQMNFFATFKFAMSETTLKRFFVGFSGSATLATNMGTDRPNVAHVGLSFSTGVPDTNFQWSSDSAAGSPTISDSGVAASTNVFYLTVDALVANQFTFVLRDNTFAVLSTKVFTTDIPSESTIMTPIIATRTLTTAVKGQDFYLCNVGILGQYA